MQSWDTVKEAGCTTCHDSCGAGLIKGTWCFYRRKMSQAWLSAKSIFVPPSVSKDPEIIMGALLWQCFCVFATCCWGEFSSKDKVNSEVVSVGSSSPYSVRQPTQGKSVLFLGLMIAEKKRNKCRNTEPIHNKFPALAHSPLWSGASPRSHRTHLLFVCILQQHRSFST